MADLKAKNTKAQDEKKVVSAKLRSRVNYDVTFKYEGRDTILAPRQTVTVPDVSKVSGINPKEVLRVKES